jgi:hypothetical protein
MGKPGAGAIVHVLARVQKKLKKSENCLLGRSRSAGWRKSPCF